MSSDWEMEHFGTPDEPGAPGHRAWLEEQRSATTWIAHHRDGSQCEQATTTHDCPRQHEYTPAPAPVPTLNDELADEAKRVALRSHADLARRGTRHDPEL